MDPVELLTLAEKYIAKDMPEKAVETLKTCTSQYPDNFNANMALGKLYLGMGLLDKAIDEFERVVERVPTHLLAHKKLSALYNSIGDIEKTEESYRNILFINPYDEVASAALRTLVSYDSKRGTEFNEIDDNDVESIDIEKMRNSNENREGEEIREEGAPAGDDAGDPEEGLTGETQLLYNKEEEVYTEEKSDDRESDWLSETQYSEDDSVELEIDVTGADNNFTATGEMASESVDYDGDNGDMDDFNESEDLSEPEEADTESSEIPDTEPIDHDFVDNEDAIEWDELEESTDDEIPFEELEGDNDTKSLSDEIAIFDSASPLNAVQESHDGEIDEIPFETLETEALRSFPASDITEPDSDESIRTQSRNYDNDIDNTSFETLEANESGESYGPDIPATDTTGPKSEYITGNEEDREGIEKYRLDEVETLINSGRLLDAVTACEKLLAEHPKDSQIKGLIENIKKKVNEKDSLAIINRYENFLYGILRRRNEYFESRKT